METVEVENAERAFVANLTVLAQKHGHAYGEFRVTNALHVSIGVTQGAHGMSYNINGNIATGDEATAYKLMMIFVGGQVA